MNIKSWLLTDTSTGEYVEELKLTDADVPGYSGAFSIHKRRLRGGVQDGVDVITVSNGDCRFTVLPTRGMGLWRAACKDLEVGWRSPIRGPVNPAFVPLSEPSGLGWLDGFDELLVRCGLESNGAPVHDEQGKLLYPLHGKIANTPAHRVEIRIDPASGEIAIEGRMLESRLFFNKLELTSTLRCKPGERGFRITDEVANPAQHPSELELLYHVNFGAPLLEPDAYLVAPVKTLVPRNSRAAEDVQTWDKYTRPEPGAEEQVYFMELLADSAGQTQTLLRNAHGNAGVSLHFNLGQLPVFTLWKSKQAEGDGYVTGLEPATNYPNPRPFEKEQGRVKTVAPGGRHKFELALEIHPDAESVATAEEATRELQTALPDIKSKPQSPWTSDG